MMKYVIVNPNGRFHPLQAIEPPLWAGLIASYLRSQGDMVSIMDAEALDYSIDETEQAINQFHFDKVIIIVMGNNPSVSSTPKMPIAEQLAGRLPYDKVFLTGLHPVAVGSKYQVITKPFEGTPMMPWDLLPMDKYRAHHWHCLDGSPRSPYASVYTSLGCPYDCYVCNIHTLYHDRKVRFRPIPNVVHEVERLANWFHVRNIKFWDELFTLREDRVLEICDSIKDYDLNIWAYARLDSVNNRMLKAMKKGHINWIAYGFESVKDKKFIETTEEVIRMTRDAGINIIANFMFGMPQTTQEDDERSVDFAQRHLFEFVNFYVAKPYPGSQWYKDVKPDLSWNDYNQYGTNRLAFRDVAFRDYFNNPAYLAMIQQKFGNSGLDVIRRMMLYKERWC